MAEHDEHFNTHSVDEQFERYAQASVSQPTTPASQAVQSLVQIYTQQAAHEQETLERLRQRLAHTAATAQQGEAVSEAKNIPLPLLPVHTSDTSGGVPIQRARSLPTVAPRSRHGRRFGRSLQQLVAVLLVGALIGSFVMVLLHQKSLQSGHALQGSWRVVATPAFAGKTGGLFKISAVSANDVWALGVSYPGGSGTSGTPLIEHWNGLHWSLASFPGSAFSAGVGAIAAVARDDVWVVGSSRPYSYQPLIEHWDGKRWSAVDAHLRGFAGHLVAITARSANDVWAVGAGDFQNGRVPLFLHWDGQQWSVAPQAALPAEMQEPSLEAVTVLGPNDAWAVGEVVVNRKSRQLIEHWNGRQWRLVQDEKLAELASLLETGSSVREVAVAVTASSANDVWILGRGWHDPDGATSQSPIEHWDGKQWHIMFPPAGVMKNGFFYDIIARAANDVWAVGSTSDGKSDLHLHTLVEHWDGKQWHMVPSPNVSSQCQNELFTLTGVPGSATLWAAGYSANKSCKSSVPRSQLLWAPLIEAYVP